MEDNDKNYDFSKPRAEWGSAEFEKMKWAEKYSRTLIASLPERVMILDGTNFSQHMCMHYAVGFPSCDIMVDVEDSEGGVVFRNRPLGLLMSEAYKCCASWPNNEMDWDAVKAVWEKRPDEWVSAFDDVYSKGKRNKPAL